MPSFASVVQPLSPAQVGSYASGALFDRFVLSIMSFVKCDFGECDFGERQEAGHAVRRGRAASEWLREPLLLAPSLRAERVGPAAWSISRRPKFRWCFCANT